MNKLAGVEQFEKREDTLFLDIDVAHLPVDKWVLQVEQWPPTIQAIPSERKKCEIQTETRALSKT
jgi:hypothetical protein